MKKYILVVAEKEQHFDSLRKIEAYAIKNIQDQKFIDLIRNAIDDGFEITKTLEPLDPESRLHFNELRKKFINGEELQFTWDNDYQAFRKYFERYIYKGNYRVVWDNRIGVAEDIVTVIMNK